MSSSDYLLKATINRLSARLSQKIIDSATKLALISQKAPEKLRKEWELFQEEVNEEANRLDDENPDNKQENSYEKETKSSEEKINQIRSKVSKLSNAIENDNR